MFDIKAVEAEARKELAKEQGEVAKGKLKAKLKAIAAAKAVVANLEREYGALILEAAADGIE